MYFIGYSISCLILPRVCDLYGRKKIYFTCISLQVFIMLGIVVNKNFKGQLALIFFMGVVGVGRSTIGFLYLIELVPPKNKKLIGTLVNTGDAFVYVFSSFYFWVVSKHTQYYLIIGVVLNVFVAVAVFFIPESPDFLHDIRDYDRTRKVFQFIARFNRIAENMNLYIFEKEAQNNLKISQQLSPFTVAEKEQSKVEIDLSESSKEKKNLPENDIIAKTQHSEGPQSGSNSESLRKSEQEYDENNLTGSLKELFKIKRLFFNLVVLALILICIQFNYFMINFQLKYIPGNIYLN